MKKMWLMGAVAISFVAPLGAFAAGQTRTIAIAVTAKGFEPARVKVAKGEPLKLVVTRKTDDTCAKEIVIPDENIKAELPLNKPVTLSFTPKKSGEIRYTCGMDMVSGVLQVASSDEGGGPATSADERRRETQGMHGMSGMGMKDHEGGAINGMSCGCMHRGTRSNGS
jgi:plastocyanin